MTCDSARRSICSFYSFFISRYVISLICFILFPPSAVCSSPLCCSLRELKNARAITIIITKATTDMIMIVISFWVIFDDPSSLSLSPKPMLLVELLSCARTSIDDSLPISYLLLVPCSYASSGSNSSSLFFCSIRVIKDSSYKVLFCR